MRCLKDPESLRRLQQRLAQHVEQVPIQNHVQYVAGVDVSYHRPTRQMVGGIVVLHWPTLKKVDEVFAVMPVPFPYIPGLLSFRELPVLFHAVRQLHQEVDLFLVDGQGIWHPRNLGLAAHFGLLVQTPTIGVAKSPLIRPRGEPGLHKGEVVWDTHGAVVRTRTGVRPVYVSVGHRITLPEAVEWVLRLSVRTRLPEPIRLADHQTREQAHRLSSNPSSP